AEHIAESLTKGSRGHVPKRAE
ncbi:MAG: hypothetical protein QOI36_1511, partial [Pseudonocardiales bacterium]|nr:hypothetical protein [Pseudonocardiales bacterium]